MFTDIIEECCLVAHIPLRTFFHLATSQMTWANADEQETFFFNLYKTGGMKALENHGFIAEYADDVLRLYRASQCASY